MKSNILILLILLIIFEVHSKTVNIQLKKHHLRPHNRMMKKSLKSNISTKHKKYLKKLSHKKRFIPFLIPAAMIGTIAYG